MEYITKDARETQELGARIGSALKGGEVLALFGEMGTGKTTFVQGLANAIGVTRPITSPTFIIMRHYVLSRFTHDIRNLYHVDLYRLEDNADQQITEIGITDLWGKPENIFIIEWAEKLTLLPKEVISIKFENHLEDSQRKITIENFNNQL